MTPELSTLRPTGTSNVSMMSGFMIDRPMKPHTTEGIAASSSTRTFSASRTRPVANSAMKIAAPRENGTETSMARPVTLAVPTMSASAPNVGSGSDVGRHAIDPKNSPKLNSPKTKPKPSRVMKTKIPMMKTIAEMPPTKTTAATALSTYQAGSR